MTQPVSYDRQYNFQNFQTENPSSPLPADKVDLELNHVKSTADQLIANIGLIQRDDGRLANNSVGLDQLDATISIGFGAPTVWTTAHNYVPMDTVFNAGKFYRCLVAHTSGVFATDLGAGKWELIADLTSITATLTELQAADSPLTAATTTDLAGTTTFRVAISGSTTITSFGATSSNKVRFVRFTGAPLLTNSGNLVLPSGANIQAASGDCAIFCQDGTGNIWTCYSYMRASGLPIVGTTDVAETTVPSAATTDIGAVLGQRVVISGTTGITSLGTVANKTRHVRFTGALKITHNGTSLILPDGIDIKTVAGDTAVFQSDASGNWRCAWYTPVAEAGHFVGQFVIFAGPTLPPRCLWPDGRNVLRSDYPLLLNALTATCTGVTTSGNATIASVSVDLRGLGLEGAAIEGTGIQASTTISSVTATTIVLSQNANASGTSSDIRIFPHGNGNGSTTVTLPDARGCALAGRDDLGGTAASRLSSTHFGVAPRLGARAGAESGALSQAQLPNVTLTTTVGAGQGNHLHTYTGDPAGSNGPTGGGGVPGPQGSQNTGSATLPAMSGTTPTGGSGTAHTKMQPTALYNVAIYAGE